jgi:hypothetical protein
MKPRRLAVLIVAALALSAACALTATAQVPNLPGGDIPSIPEIPGQEKARFKVVVEGEARSYVEIAGVAGEEVGCIVRVKGVVVDEQVKYGRGKGVTMEFVRFKAAGRSVVSLQRSGRTGDASFAVRGTIARAVARDGSLTRTPVFPNPCPAVAETPASTPGCNTTFPLSADLKFVYGAPAGTLKLRPTDKETLAGESPVERCPGSELFSNLPGYVKNAWPVPLNLPAARLSASTIFGRRPGFTLRFRKVIPEYNEPTGIVLKGSQNLYSGHTAIARFTRLK